MSKTIKWSQVRVGDELADGAFVTGVYRDPEGLWIDTDDGEAGYVSADRKVRVTR